MTLTYIKWRDASSQDTASNEPPKPELVDLEEIGFLLAENDEAIQIAMEHCPAGTHGSRYRLNIPKINILERLDLDFNKVLGRKVPKTRRPRSKKASESTPSPVVTGLTGKEGL